MVKGKVVEAVRASKKSGTVIAGCVCRHTAQDKLYNGKRLHNLCSEGAKKRCTVCSKETVI